MMDNENRKIRPPYTNLLTRSDELSSSEYQLTYNREKPRFEILNPVSKSNELAKLFDSVGFLGCSINHLSSNPPLILGILMQPNAEHKSSYSKSFPTRKDDVSVNMKKKSIKRTVTRAPK